MPVRVALPLPNIEPLTYGVPPGVAVERGKRVLVPLGRRVVTGTVVDLEVPEVSGMRMIAEVLDEVPSFTADMVKLLKRVSDYYLCSWGEALHAALPAGLSPTSVVRIRQLRTPSAVDLLEMDSLAPRRARLLKTLGSHSGPITTSYLQKQLGGGPISDQISALVAAGWITVEADVEQDRQPRMVRYVQISEELVADGAQLKMVFDELDKRAPKQSLALGQLLLAHHGGKRLLVRDLCETLQVTSAVVDALATKGLAVIRSAPREAEGHASSLLQRSEQDVSLTPEQTSAISQISQATDRKQFRTMLLHGVTGSGKTLVYIRAIQHVLEAGKTALVLVPEISLTPQLADRFTAVFGNNVAVLHSRLPVGERIGVWQKIQQGEYKVVIGARSAVFAPLPSLGLIVVDEEHEQSYKQESPAPRYNGRDVAIMRAHQEECPVVLGSATPSLESIAMVQSGRAQVLHLTHRADGAVVPQITVIDMKEERKAQRISGSFSFCAINTIAQHVAAGNGVIVFLNRRGYATQRQCADCADVVMCPNCDVSLTYHKSAGTLMCHYCGLSQQAQDVCLVCGSVDVADLGTGTQRLEDELRNVLEERLGTVPTIERMDADTTRARDAHRTVLDRFAKGQIDVLVGTQMVAKGLDISRVTLVVVVNADAALHRTNFRASERTIQLLTQVAGRAGRTQERPGTVLIQTYSPHHPAIIAAVQGEHNAHALRTWEDGELQHRAEAGYPPFTRLIVLELSGLDESMVEHHANIVAALIPKQTDYMVRLDPCAPSIARIRNHYRRIIVIKNLRSADPSGALCRSLLKNVVQKYHAEHATASVRLTVDVDASGGG